MHKELSKTKQVKLSHMGSMLHMAISQGQKVLCTVRETCFQQFKRTGMNVVQPK